MANTEAVSMLQSVFDDLAGEDQNARAARMAVAMAIVEMQNARESDRAICLMLASAIVDGLQHGNWIVNREG